MKLFFSIIFCGLNFLIAQTGSKIILKGNYEGYNLYVQNPRDENSTGYCTKKVLVNGKEYPIDSTQSPAFKIDLKSFGLSEGDSLEIEITHSADCKPKVLNPGPITPRRTNIFNLRIENDSLIKWSALRKINCHSFSVQQFRWLKWIPWEKVDCIKENVGDTVHYSVEIKKYLHSGTNKFQISLNNLSVPVYSSQIHLDLPEEKEISFHKKGIDYRKTPVDLGKVTHWELYDEFGRELGKGYSRTFFIKDLKPKTTYYLNYDNKRVDFVWSL